MTWTLQSIVSQPRGEALTVGGISKSVLVLPATLRWAVAWAMLVADLEVRPTVQRFVEYPH